MKKPPIPIIFDFSKTVVATAAASKEGAQLKALRRAHGDIRKVTHCPFCETPVRHWVATIKSPHRYPPDYDIETDQLVLCGACGWWRKYLIDWSDLFAVIYLDRTALLTKRSVADHDAPLEEVERVLRKNWRYAKNISAGKAEELIASIFADHLNCEIHYQTNGVFTPDGGIDFVLVNSEAGLEFAFQVKRRTNASPEHVQPVRAFIGAVAMSRHRHAFYVTTADRFTRTAIQEIGDAKEQLTQRGLTLRLVNGTEIQSLLKQRKARPSTCKKLIAQFAATAGWSELSLKEAKSGDWNPLGTERRRPSFTFSEVLAQTFDDFGDSPHP